MLEANQSSLQVAADKQPLAKKFPRSAEQPRALRDFFLWYLIAFVVAQIWWHLSALVRQFDFLEVPMTAVLFPLAGFLDPHDGMVNDPATFFWAIAFWAAVIPIALLLTPRRLNPLITAFGIIATCSLASIAYSVIQVAAASSME